MRQDVHDPYRNWKFIAMILALAVLALCITGLLTDINVSVVFAALLMGASKIGRASCRERVSINV